MSRLTASTVSVRLSPRALVSNASTASVIPVINIAGSTDEVRWIVCGLGIGLNLALLFSGHYGFCSACSGLNAVLAFPWPVAGIAYWIGAIFAQRWIAIYAFAGTALALTLIGLGRIETGRFCLSCALHLLVLLTLLIISLTRSRVVP
jgi:hypothetical protein